MLRDRNFERSLLAEINRIKIAARKMHNNRKMNYVDHKAEALFDSAVVELVSIAYHD